ncbi:hypothetical protein EDB84DRAFT_1596280 [Lactarius hengduanensis]|nr:hypothetical protein EDB84DRAFT_1596280 [Lactarius hengduanensis]
MQIILRYYVGSILGLVRDGSSWRLDPMMLVVSVKDFTANARRGMNPGPDVKKWTSGGLKRSANGRFADADVARILQNATAAPAHAFAARGTPEVLHVVELLGTEQGRG